MIPTGFEPATSPFCQGGALPAELREKRWFKGIFTGLYKRNAIKKAVVIVIYVTICDHKIMFLAVCIMAKGMR